MRLHIHACADCHARVLARDPLQLFAPLSDEERGEEFWAGFWPAVRADIHALEARRRSWRDRVFRPAVAWAAAAGAVAVAALVVVARLGGGGPEPAGGGEGWPEALPVRPAVVAASPAVPSVEDVRSPTAKVLSVKVYGEGEAVTEVVLIVDERIEL
jgi:hypothetical protein